MDKQYSTQFKNLVPGARFDFIGGNYVSFFDTCIKTSPRKYISIDTGKQYAVGTVNCMVYHVSETGFKGGVIC